MLSKDIGVKGFRYESMSARHDMADWRPVSSRPFDARATRARTGLIPINSYTIRGVAKIVAMHLAAASWQECVGPEVRATFKCLTIPEFAHVWRCESITIIRDKRQNADAFKRPSSEANASTAETKTVEWFNNMSRHLGVPAKM